MPVCLGRKTLDWMKWEKARDAWHFLSAAKEGEEGRQTKLTPLSLLSLELSDTLPLSATHSSAAIPPLYKERRVLSVCLVAPPPPRQIREGRGEEGSNEHSSFAQTVYPLPPFNGRRRRSEEEIRGRREAAKLI